MTAGERWDERYRQVDLVPFPASPPEWLAEHRDLLTGGGRALDLACGTGGAARYLAELGYEVVAVDASEVVVEALREAAREQGLSIDARVLDLEHEPIPAGPYDVIVILKFLQRNLFEAIQAALAPGGLLFHETFSVVDEPGKVVNPSYLLERDELLRAYPELEVIDHRIVDDAGDRRGIAGLVARRPAP